MRVLGIEFGTWSVKAAEMESRFRRFEVLEFHEIRLPLKIQDPIEVYRDAISQLLKKLPANPEKIVAALPPNQTAIRFLPFPIKKRKKVEQMYRFDLEDAIPFRLQDCILNHHWYPTKEGSLLLAALSPKRNIESYLTWLQGVGVEADWLTFEGMGLLNIYLSALAEQEEEARPSDTTLLLDIGHNKTNISAIRNERLEFFRTLSWGGSNINHAIAINTGVALEDAETLKHTKLKLTNDSNEAENELVASARQAIAPLLVDLNHSMVSYRNLYKSEIASIQITGGTAETKGIDSYLGAALNIPVVRFAPFEHLELKPEIKNSTDQFRFSEAWGRALVFARKAPILFNFRQAELARQTSLNEVSAIFSNPHIIKLAQYASILFLILFLHVTAARYFSDKELTSAGEELKKIFQDTFRSVQPKTRATLLANPVELRKFIEQKNTDLEKKLKMLNRSKVSRLSLLASVSGSFPKTVRVDVNDLQIDDTQMLIDGVLYEGDLNQVTEAIKKIPHVSDVTVQQEGQRFTYRGKVVGQ